MILLSKPLKTISKFFTNATISRDELHAGILMCDKYIEKDGKYVLVGNMSVRPMLLKPFANDYMDVAYKENGIEDIVYGSKGVNRIVLKEKAKYTLFLKRIIYIGDLLKKVGYSDELNEYELFILLDNLILNNKKYFYEAINNESPEFAEHLKHILDLRNRKPRYFEKTSADSTLNLSFEVGPVFDIEAYKTRN